MMSAKKKEVADRCAIVSCVCNRAYGGGPPELRRCENGHGIRLGDSICVRGLKLPCRGEYESGVKNSKGSSNS